jgi:hypothetical protein
MTTPNQHTPHAEATGHAEEFGTRNAPTASPAGRTASSAATPTESLSGQTDVSPATQTESSSGQTDSSAESTDSATDESLFGDLLSGLRSRWDDVQASFVDDPKQCVQKADRLVSDVVDRLKAGFDQARSRLEEPWARGEEASTEDLRQALKRYREFFQRLLSVEDNPAEHRGP